MSDLEIYLPLKGITTHPIILKSKGTRRMPPGSLPPRIKLWGRVCVPWTSTKSWIHGERKEVHLSWWMDGWPEMNKPYSEPIVTIYHYWELTPLWQAAFWNAIRRDYNRLRGFQQPQVSAIRASYDTGFESCHRFFKDTPSCILAVSSLLASLQGQNRASTWRSGKCNESYSNKTSLLCWYCSWEQDGLWAPEPLLFRCNVW